MLYQAHKHWLNLYQRHIPRPWYINQYDKAALQPFKPPDKSTLNLSRLHNTFVSALFLSLCSLMIQKCSFWGGYNCKITKTSIRLVWTRADGPKTPTREGGYQKDPVSALAGRIRTLPDLFTSRPHTFPLFSGQPFFQPNKWNEKDRISHSVAPRPSHANALFLIVDLEWIAFYWHQSNGGVIGAHTHTPLWRSVCEDPSFYCH